MKKINVLGTEYEVIVRGYGELTIFEKQSISGYCDDILHNIVICDITTHPGYEDETEEYCRKVEKMTLRHEIVHAFLNESGLQASTCVPSESGWARNEEMVDWIAIQLPKIMKAFEEADAL